MGLPENVPAVDAEEAGIVRERTPVGVGKMPQFVDRGAADLARTVRVGAGVIDEIASGVFLNLAFPEINHAVEGHVVAVLPVEDEVARLGVIEVARDEVRVAQLQRLGVGELGEAAGGEVGGLKSAGLHAKKAGPQRRVGVLIFRDGRDARRHRQMRLRRPIAIVGAQRFAIRIADQRGAIDNLGRAPLGRLEVLRLGEKGEPAAERSLVVGVVQAQKIGRAVGGGICRVEIGQQAN